MKFKLKKSAFGPPPPPLLHDGAACEHQTPVGEAENGSESSQHSVLNSPPDTDQAETIEESAENKPRPHWLPQVPSCAAQKQHQIRLWVLGCQSPPKETTARHVSPTCQRKAHGRRRRPRPGPSGVRRLRPSAAVSSANQTRLMHQRSTHSQKSVCVLKSRWHSLRPPP